MKVRCINIKGCENVLILHKEYEVIEEDYDFIYVIDERPKEGGFFHCRFEEVIEVTEVDNKGSQTVDFSFLEV